MSTHDNQGREWLRVADIKEGLLVETNGGITCIEGRRTISEDKALGMCYVTCTHGHHYLAAQLNPEGTHYVGFYKVEPAVEPADRWFAANLYLNNKFIGMVEVKEQAHPRITNLHSYTVGPWKELT